MTLDACYRKDPSIVFRQIAGEAVLVPVRKNMGDLESIYALNDTAATAWHLLDGQRTLAEIRDCLLDEYEAEPAQVEADLTELVTQLLEIKAIQQV